MQSSPHKLTSQTKRNSLCQLRLRRLDNLGQIVSFVLGAPEEVLAALVSVCELFFNDQCKFRLRVRLTKSPVVGRWRRLNFNPRKLEAADKKTIAKMCQDSHTEARTLARKDARTRTRARKPSKMTEDLPPCLSPLIKKLNLALAFDCSILLITQAFSGIFIALAGKLNIACAGCGRSQWAMHLPTSQRGTSPLAQT